MKTATIQLGEVMTIDRTTATEAECQTLPYVGLEHIEKDAGNFADDFRRQSETLLATKFRFTRRHVLYGKLRPNLNKVALPDFDGVCTTEIFPLMPQPQTLDRRYLYAVLLSQRFVKWASNSVSGANLPRLDPERLREYEVRLPDLTEQQRVAERLEQADRLRRTRRHALELTDTFLPAAFLELFGDPEKNPLGWPESELSELCDEVLDCPHSTPIYTGIQTPHPCVRSSDIQKGYLDFSEAKYVSPREYQKRIARGKPMPGDVIYCREGARFGNAGRIIDKTEMCLGQRTMLFRANPKVAVGEFIWAFLSSSGAYRQATRALDGSASPHVNVGEIVTFRVPIPPLSLQHRFASICERVDHLRALQREALRQSEHLFQTLLHRAFS
jgi:type I restriction enzyme S subunit